MDIWDRAPAPLQLCRTPYKRKFPDRAGAERKARRQERFDREFDPYLCRCGWWHLTTRKGAKGA